MGPFAPAKVETAGPYEHCSVLKLVEWRWGLEPMSARDRNAKNLVDVLDFGHRRDAFVLPPFPATASPPCPAG
jgi:phospholipase C